MPETVAGKPIATNDKECEDLSDFYRDQPNPNDPFRMAGQEGNAPWGVENQDLPVDGYEPDVYGMKGDPFAPYDDPSAQPQGNADYSAWQPPQPVGSAFLSAEPAPLGAQMQQGGVPLFADEPAQDFMTQGDDAPTRIGRPINAQMVSKRTTVVRPGASRSPFARPTDDVQEPSMSANDALPTTEDASPYAPPARRSAQASASEVSPYAPPAQQDGAEQASTEGATAAPPRRRRSRMDRYANQPQEEPAVASEPQTTFDPFQAGDSEMQSEQPQATPPAERAERRVGVPGGRYTGPRTAMPVGGVQPRPTGVAAPRRQSAIDSDNVDEAYDETILPDERRAAPAQRPVAQRPVAERPVGAAQRPAGVPGQRPVGQRPAGAPAQRPAGAPAQRPAGAPAQRAAGVPGQRPVGQRPAQGAKGPAQPGQRPAQAAQRAAAGQRPAPQGRRAVPASAAMGAQGMEDGDLAVRRQMPVDGQAPFAYRSNPRPQDDEPYGGQASVKRNRYDFEDEEEELEPRRKGGVLVPILVVLLVIGGLLAGICLPDWEGIGGGIGGAMAAIKSPVVAAFTSIKNMIAPEEDPIKSFSVAASETEAPAQVIFTVQTSKNVAGLRIADANGQTVYNGAYSADMELTGEVISNSNVLLWKPTYTVEDAYNGGFTAYALLSNGEESEGVSSVGTLVIEQSVPAAPAMQSFTCDTQTAALPAHVGFTVVTSTDVTAVRVADSYGTPVATMYASDVGDENATMVESGNTRTWTLNVDVANAYVGDYVAQYQTGDDDLNFTQSDESVAVALTEDGASASDASGTAAQGETAPTGDDAAAAAMLSAEEPVATPEPTVEPTATPEPTPEPVPTTTPLPALSATAAEAATPDAANLKATLYSNGKTTDSFTRTMSISMLSPFTTSSGGSDYAVWKQAGVLTFRSGPMRQNAAYGTVEAQTNTLSQVWSQPIGSMKVSGGTYYGVGAPGQAVIVKWPTELRQRMGITDAMKEVTALKEVVVAAQDGNIYFYNLLTGEATRDPIALGAPSRGGLSVATNGTPILGVGQYNARLSNGTVPNGYHILNLLTNQKETLIECDGKDKNSNYTGVTGAALFDSQSGTMIFGSQNGLLYTAELGTQKEAYDNQTGKISLSSSIQGYKTLAGKQAKKNTNIDAAVAMYNNYVYYADQAGIVQCVDVNTMTPVWAVDTGDNVDSTPALDIQDGQTLALYTGNTILNQGRNGVCTIRRLNALTGEVDWSYEVPELKKNTEYDIGVYASPVVGQESISDLVIFTVSKGAAGAEIIAFNKQSGSIAWQTALETTTISSPVAVYDESGNARLVQAEGNGNVHLLNAKTGEILNTLALQTAEGENVEIEASPAVYGNLMIIGSTGRDKGGVYCVKID